MFLQSIINFDQCCQHEIKILTVYQVGVMSKRYNICTYAITNKQNNGAKEQCSPVYMISHFETIETESGKTKYIQNDR